MESAETKKEGKTVYVVVLYARFHVKENLAVFSTKEAAEEFMRTNEHDYGGLRSDGAALVQALGLELEEFR